MTPPSRDAEADEIAALLAAGALSPTETDLAERQAGAPAYRAVTALLLDGFPALAPPAGVKDRLLARVAQVPDPRHPDRLAASGLPEIAFQFSEDAKFDSTPYPGLWIRVLHVDPAREQFSAVIRLDPGGSFPEHAHDGPEECLVLAGELLVGGVRMKTGDYQRLESGTKHVEQWSPGGALLFLTAPLGLLGS